MFAAAQRLLDAHVTFVLRQLDGDAFADAVRADVAWALARANEVTLDDVLDRELVKGVAAKYVARFELPGAIPEVVGEIAARLTHHPAQETTLGEVVDRRHVVAVVEKIAELPAMRQAVADRIATNPSVQAWLAQYLYGLATSPLVTNRRLAQRLPGVSTAFKVGERLAGGVVREADQMSRELAERTAIGILQRWRDGMAASLADDEFAEALLSLWDQVADRRLSDALADTDETDLADFVVIGYALWLDVRGTDYLRSLVDTGVNYFFDTYGGFGLADLLAEFGLGHDDLVEEALRFAPSVIAGLRSAGLLEDLVRRRLADFYASPEFAAALAASPG